MSGETINGWWKLITLLLSVYTIGVCVSIRINRRNDGREEKNERD